MKTDKSQEAEERRQKVVALVMGSEEIMAQLREARAARERGEPLFPFAQVRAEAEARRRHA